MTKKLKKRLYRIIAGAVCYAACMALEKLVPVSNNVLLIAFLVTYFIIGGDVLKGAAQNIIKGQIFDEKFLMVIATIGAFLSSQYPEAVAVMLFYQIGEWFQSYAVNKSRRSIKDLMDIRPDYANVYNEAGELVSVDPDEVSIGTTIVVKPGEKIPLDGEVIKGETSLDTMALTGESLPREIHTGDEVISGCINLSGVIEVKTSKEFGESTVAKILNLVENATAKKAEAENFISKFAKYYTPIVVFLAVALAIIPSVITGAWGKWVYRALCFLVISCPCALVISIPLSFFGGIGAASKAGILVKGSNYLDNLSRVNKIVFDKTGTLTTGTFNVQKIKIYDDSYTEEQIIEILIKGESLSNHPIAQSLIKFFDKKYTNKDVKEYKELTGKGIEYDLGENHIKVGTIKLCDDCSKEASLHVNINGKHIASIIIDDGIKENAKSFIEKLHKACITTYMFTGDKKSTALEIQKKLGIENVEYEMLPNDKYCEYEKIKSDNDVIAFVGDGINDAPLLKRADIGISMGGIGSSSAIEASDIVIMNDDLEKINKGIDISKYTNKIIKQNLIFAISVKIIILSLSVFGITTMWWAVFADTGVTLITILNTLKIIKKFNK